MVCCRIRTGSCGPRRFSQPVTMAVVEVEEETGNFRVARKDIAQDAPALSDRKSGRDASVKGKADGAGGVAQTAFSEERLQAILRDIDKEKSISDIAAKYGISKELAGQICRLYLTHPGIDAAGVREKMGLPRDR